MKQLVEINGKKTFIRSRQLARGCEVEHEATVVLIKKYQTHFNEIGLSDLKSECYKTGGRTGTEYLLDEIQSTFLITLMRNSDKVVLFKMKLTKEFFKQRRIISELIARQQTPDWIEARTTGKSIYHQKTTIISEFVDYAYLYGSKSSQFYYANLAKMENSALFFFEQRHPNLREVMTIRQLMLVSAADVVIEKALKEGMDKSLHYKDCYKLAKERVIAFAELIGKSPILSLTEK